MLTFLDPVSGRLFGLLFSSSDFASRGGCSLFSGTDVILGCFWFILVVAWVPNIFYKDLHSDSPLKQRSFLHRFCAGPSPGLSLLYFVWSTCFSGRPGFFWTTVSDSCNNVNGTAITGVGTSSGAFGVSPA